MTNADVVPDRGDLHERARSTLRRRRLVGAGLGVAILLIGPLLGFVATGGEFSGRVVLISLVPVAVGGLVMLALRPVMRRQDRNPAPLLGADRETRRAVQEAVRTGRAKDARVAALARDAAERTLRLTWLLWVSVGAMLLQAFLVVVRLVRGAGWVGIAFGAVTAAAFGASAIGQLIGRRRSRRFLEPR